MQLEIKIVIDFGDDLAPEYMNEILRMVDDRLQEHVLQPVCGMYVAKASTMTGWASSGDDEEEEEEEDEDTYSVIKFIQDEEAKVVSTGLTLDEAQAECDGPDSTGNGWFLGFRKE